MPQTSLHCTIIGGQEGRQELYPPWEVTVTFPQGIGEDQWGCGHQVHIEIMRCTTLSKVYIRRDLVESHSNKIATHTPPLVSVKVMWEAGTRQSYPAQLESFKGGLVRSQKSHPCLARMRRPLKCHWRSSEGLRFLLSSHSSKAPFLSRTVFKKLT